MTEWDIVKLQEMAWSDFALKHGLVSQLPRKSEHQWIGFQGKNYRKTPWSSWENRWFPVDFPLSQSIENSPSGITKCIGNPSTTANESFHDFKDPSRCREVASSETRVVTLKSQERNWCTRPGKRLQFANLKMAIEIVNFPIQHGDFPYSMFTKG